MRPRANMPAESARDPMTQSTTTITIAQYIGKSGKDPDLATITNGVLSGKSSKRLVAL